MKNTLITLILSFFLFSCQNSSDAGKINFPEAPETMYCFEGQRDDERYLLRFYIEKEEILGVMEFYAGNREDRIGTIEGRLEGDTLFADLSIRNESFFLSREIAFLLTDKGLAEGKGPMEKKDNKMIFIARSDLTFGQDMILQPVNCTGK